MFAFIENLGKKGILFCEKLGLSGQMLFRALVAKPEWKKQFPLLIKQIYNEGFLSLTIIIVSGLFIGMVLGLQGYLILSTYGVSESLGILVSLALFRELGPVVTALLFAGRAGSTLTAEIGLMKATEQLASLEMMAIDPIRRILTPRFWAGIISMPILAIIFTSVGIFGGYLVGVVLKGIDSGFFWSSMNNAVSFQTDVLNSIIKSIVFAIAILWIALFNGFYSRPTSEGVSYATTRTVVYSSLVVLGLDFILTYLMFGV